MKRMISRAIKGLLLATVVMMPAAVLADSEGSGSCQGLPSHAQLQAALAAAVVAETSGLNNQMWATLVNRDGIVCAVAFSGVDRAAQWPGSRVISAQKANTANAFGLDSRSSSNGSGQAAGLALSTANLYSAVQPGGSLFGLQLSNPVDPAPPTRARPRASGVPTIRWWAAGRRRERLRRRARPLQRGQEGSGRPGRQRRHVVRRPQHRLAGPPQPHPGFPGRRGGVSGDPAPPDNIVFDITPNPSGGTGTAPVGSVIPPA